MGTKHIMLFFSSYINCGASPGEGGTGSKNHVKKLHSILIGMHAESSQRFAKMKQVNTCSI